jgi:hypothetical protein
MAERQAAEAGRRHPWRWGFAAGVMALLLLNGVEEQRSSRRIAAMVTGSAHVVQARREAPAAGSLRARVTLLATLLRDPDAL